MQTPLRFELSSTVWGEKYTTTFLEFLIPNYLSDNNIPLASKHYQLFSTILTTQEDKERILSHPHYKKLREFIDGEVLSVIDGALLQSHNKWGAKGYCQSLAIKKAIANKAIILLLNPDSLISDGGLFRCCSLIEKGKKAVLIGELARIELESILPELKPYYNPESFSLTLPNRTLTALGVKHLHKVSQILFWKEDPFCHWPSIIYWRAGQKSLLAKFFHVHPLAIDLRNIRKKLPQILMPDDGGLIEFLGIRRNEIYQVTDSNELVCVEISARDMDARGYVPRPSREKFSSVLKFSLKYALFTHIKNFLNFNLRFQGTEDIDWKEIEMDAADSLKPIRLALHAISWINLLKDSIINFLRSTARKLGMGYLKRKALSLLKKRM